MAGISEWLFNKIKFWLIWTSALAFLGCNWHSNSRLSHFVGRLLMYSTFKANTMDQELKLGSFLNTCVLNIHASLEQAVC